MEAQEITEPPNARSHVGLCDWIHCERVVKRAACEQTRLTCSASLCRRSVHSECLADLLASLVLPSGFNKVVCSQRCYDSTCESITTPTEMKRTSYSWYNDGPTSGVCSSSVLLEWLETGNNYARFTKTSRKRLLAAKVCGEFAKRGIRSQRAPADVTKEISRLRRQFKITTKWLAATPQQANLETSLEAAKLLCPKYDRLKAFMKPIARSKKRRVKKQRADCPTSQDTNAAHAAQDKQESTAKYFTHRAEAHIEAALSRATKLCQEAHFLRLQTTSLALYERIKLREEGVPQADIDLLIPPYRHD